MKVLITGNEGFIGKNLQLQLSERSEVELVFFNRSTPIHELPTLLQDVTFVFHLAGCNRPYDPSQFVSDNQDFTATLCNLIGKESRRSSSHITLLFASSIHAEQDTPYGASKLNAERTITESSLHYGFSAHIFRLPNVFGKWCKPNYNSAIATFCHNIARDIPISVHDPLARLTLVYIDDVVSGFIHLMDQEKSSSPSPCYDTIRPQYETTVGHVVEQIYSFKHSRDTLLIGHVGTELTRALYSSYVSYLPELAFSYPVKMHCDNRGSFVEMLKTTDSGQFSYFTAHPGVTRGGHYHHTKTEKFLVINGQALFKFRHMHTGKMYEITVSGNCAEIVESVPGWTHSITNIGSNELVVMLWANEIYDRQQPDTFISPL